MLVPKIHRTNVRSHYGKGYLDHDLPLEQQRLAALESFAGTSLRALLAVAGIRKEWRCLDIGAGTGSLAMWLAERVVSGEVVATDLNTDLWPIVIRPLPEWLAGCGPVGGCRWRAVSCWLVR
jgi:2-polyprenyl-3-methyl-5-hydroxy-6-metoxy-1,4-benzoquinol methylase